MCRNDEPQVLSYLQFKSDCDLRGRLEERFGLLTSLAKLHGVVRKPVAIFFYELCGSARSRSSPGRDTPWPYSTSNSACRRGGASLFLTTRTRIRFPTTSSPR